MSTRWDAPVPDTRRCAVCKSWPPDPGDTLCEACRDAESARRLEEAIEAAKLRAKHAERSK